MPTARSLSYITIFRIAFGAVWLFDGVMKFIWLQPSDVVSLVQGAAQSQNQTAWLTPFYNFWIGSVTSAPAAYLYGVGGLELTLGLALVFGFMRRIAYVGGIVLTLMIWSIDEGFGGTYGPGQTDIGAAVMYTFIFILMIIVEASADYRKYSVDGIIERKWSGWKHLAELGGVSKGSPGQA